MPERFRAPAGSQAIVAAQVAGRQFQTAVSDITIGLGSDARIAFVITSSAVIPAATAAADPSCTRERSCPCSVD